VLVGSFEPVDPLSGGGEQDPVPGLAGPHRQPDGQVGLAGAGRTKKHHILFADNEIEGAEVGDRHPVAGATGGRASMAARSAAIRSIGAQPSTRRTRRFTSSSQPSPSHTSIRGTAPNAARCCHQPGRAVFTTTSTAWLASASVICRSRAPPSSSRRSRASR